MCRERRVCRQEPPGRMRLRRAYCGTIETGMLLAVQFQPGCNRFYLLKFSVGKSEEQQFFHRYLQKSDHSFVRGHYNTDLQEYNEKQCEKMSGFPVISDCGYGADMVV